MSDQTRRGQINPGLFPTPRDFLRRYVYPPMNITNDFDVALAKVKATGNRGKLTPEIIDQIMTDRYHAGATVAEIRKTYGISHDVYKQVDSKHGAAFKDRFGVIARKAQDITADEMQAYWDAKAAQTAPSTSGPAITPRATKAKK